MPYLVIVTGKPASGKTTLGTRLARDLAVPFVSKDDIKEALFDAMGWSDRAGSRTLGIASFRVLYVVLERLLTAGVSAVTEAPFDPQRAATDFTALRERHPFDAVQVVCRADGDVLIERYHGRNASGDRHPGHMETDDGEDIDAYLRGGEFEPVAITSAVIEVDTTHPATVDYGKLLLQVRRTLQRQ